MVAKYIIYETELFYKIKTLICFYNLKNVIKEISFQNYLYIFNILQFYNILLGMSVNGKLKIKSVFFNVVGLIHIILLHLILVLISLKDTSYNKVLEFINLLVIIYNYYLMFLVFT